MATGGFSFVPQEAPIPSVMNLTMIVLDEPSQHFAACFTNNALCGSPITVGRKRLAESPALQAIVVNNKISNVCAAGDGVAASEAVCAAAAAALKLPGGAGAVLPCSAGVIGWGLLLFLVIITLFLAHVKQITSKLATTRRLVDRKNIFIHLEDFVAYAHYPIQS